MNRKFTTCLLLLIGLLSTGLFAQNPANIHARTTLDSRLGPFYHGVASGDPLFDRVIIWTRITPDTVAGPITVDWAMATDTGITNIVKSGTATTDSSMDWTIKVDVTGLQPNTWYYYRFERYTRKSLTGRTRTAPVGAVDSVRFAVVSCSDYVDGFFHGYRFIAEANDVDGVIHLGDYIYENGQEGSLGRAHDPPERITELADYRQRYSQYHLDDDLRCIHQMYPFINVWDDHELANNSWSGGADAHDFPADGVWEHRKRMATQAYYEWLPIRHPDPQDTMRIYRKIEWGDLLSLYMIDTRIIGRDEQVTGGGIDDPNRNMIGPAQLSWIAQGLAVDTAQWTIFGQQVMMAPLEAPILGPLNNDSWDGYRAERDRLYDTLDAYNVRNRVVLTGDIHTAWANDLPGNNYNAGSGAGSNGVEFICNSITTLNSPLPVPYQVISLANDHIKWANLSDHGFYILDVNKTRTQADFHFVGDITDPTDNSQSIGPFWYTNDSSNHLLESQSPSIPRLDVYVLQPTKTPPNPVGIDANPEIPSAAIIGTYPNPFWENFVVKTYLFQPGKVHLRLFDLKGVMVKEVNTEVYEKGLHYLKVEGKDLAKGMYVLKIEASGQKFVRRVAKM